MTAQPWYDYPRIDNFGQIDPQGNYYKPDTNVLTPPGYEITSLGAGTVTSVQRTSWGQTVVTVHLDAPINSLATHMFYEHMHDGSVAVGQHVGIGSPIGHANYSGEGAALGFGFYSGDVYGSGSAWDILQHDLCPGCPNLLNPVKFMDAARGGSIPTGGGGGGGGGGGFTLSPASVFPTQFLGWISNPLRIIKMAMGVILIMLSLYMLIIPQAAGKVGSFIAQNPEVLAA